MVSYSNDASVAGNGIFLLGYAPSQSIDRVVSYARGRGAKNFAAWCPRASMASAPAAAFLAAVKSAGGTAVGMETFDRSAASVSAAVKRLATRSSYDALLIADIGRIAVQVAPQVRSSEAGANAQAARHGTLEHRQQHFRRVRRCAAPGSPASRTDSTARSRANIAPATAPRPIVWPRSAMIRCC